MIVEGDVVIDLAVDALIGDAFLCMKGVEDVLHAITGS